MHFYVFVSTCFCRGPNIDYIVLLNGSGVGKVELLIQRQVVSGLTTVWVRVGGGQCHMISQSIWAPPRCTGTGAVTFVSVRTQCAKHSSGCQRKHPSSVPIDWARLDWAAPHTHTHTYTQIDSFIRLFITHGANGYYYIIKLVWVA